MLLVRQHPRGEPVRTVALVGGIAAAAAAFTVLSMNAAAPTVRISGALPGVRQSRAYDILVRMPSKVASLNSAGSLTRPTDLGELAGGITLAQYDTIRRLPGVLVAAPMTMVGYVPLTVVIRVKVPASALTSTPAVFTVTARQSADDGLTTVTEPNAGTTYVTASGACPLVSPATSPTGVVGAAPRLTTCWSTSTGPQPQAWAGRPPSTVSVPVAWTFLLPLVAVDPAAEAQLQNLDRAVVHGGYLPTAATPTGQVPVIVATSIDDDQQDTLILERAPAGAVDADAGSSAAHPGAGASRVLGTETVTAAQAYGQLLNQLRNSGAATVPMYWTPSPAQYATAGGGALTPRPVPAHDGYRALRPHAARSAVGTGGNVAASGAAASLRLVGQFDPALVASSAATPSPYRGERLAGADQRSQQLLGGRTLGPDGNPAGYPGPGTTLVMPIQDISAFTNTAYSGTDARAPIGSIRIRVAGARGDDALSLERVRMVGQEIVRATGLHVQVTRAASADARTIDLPAGQHGRPALRLREIWYRTETNTTVVSAIDPRSVALAALPLPIGAALAASGMTVMFRGRRRELATLRALGWQRRHLAWQAGKQLALIAAAAGALAVLAADAFEAVIAGPVTGWLLLGIPAAAIMTLGAGWWQLRRTTAAPRPAARSLGKQSPNREPRRPTGGMAPMASAIRRIWLRSGLGGFVLTVACAGLGVELAVRLAFGGVIVGSWLGFPLSWQDDHVDLAAVITGLVMATIAITEICWRNGARRAGELRTLRAMGWPARGVVRLAAGEAALLGLIGGLVASAVDVAGIVMVVHRPPAGLALVVPAVIAAGLVMSLIAAALCAAVERIMATMAAT